MAKKKKSQRKRNFAYTQSGAAQQTSRSSAEQVRSPMVAKATKPESASSIEVGKLAYIRRDVKTILILALVCVGLELVLWFLLHHTSLSNLIYGR